MRRRTVIAGLGSLSASAAIVSGTGAFTSVSANRTVSVRTAPDYDAVLSLVQRGDGGRSEFDGTSSELEFKLPGEEEGDYPTGNPTDPEGLGTDSVYRFGRDAAADTQGLFSVENQGTRSLRIYGTQDNASGLPDVSVYDTVSGSLLTSDSPSETVSPGGRVLCGLQVDTHGVPVRDAEYDLTLTMNAVAADD